MNLREIRSYIFSGDIFYNRKIALLCWFGFALFGVYQGFAENGLNNYYIFKQVFYHTFNQQDLYTAYPAEYKDVNLYGLFFSLVIAPFALLPDKIGIICWILANAGLLLFAINKLPIPYKWKTFLLFLCSHELMLSSASAQVNPIICACIVLGFSYIQKQKEIYALFFIMMATFIKIYGIVGFAFFFFSKKRFSFIVWTLVWSGVFFFAPMVITSFSFLVKSYQDWPIALKAKNEKNILLTKDAIYQNISVTGMIRRIFYLPKLNDLAILVPAFSLFISQYFRFPYFNDLRLRLYILCSVLMATVLFSTGSESSTYIIVLPGMCIWFLLQPKTKWLILFFICMYALTTFAYSDIFTPWSRKHLYRPYSLKALPPFILWVIILIQIHTKQFLKAVHPLRSLYAIKQEQYV